MSVASGLAAVAASLGERTPAAAATSSLEQVYDRLVAPDRDSLTLAAT